MEGDLQELRDLIVQLRLENEKLRQEHAVTVSEPSDAPSIPAMPPTTPSTSSALPTKRLSFVPDY